MPTSEKEFRLLQFQEILDTQKGYGGIWIYKTFRVARSLEPRRLKTLARFQSILMLGPGKVMKPRRFLPEAVVEP